MKEAIFLIGLLSVGTLHAGVMGPVSADPNAFVSKPFLGLEGLYAWRDRLNDVSINNRSYTTDPNGWGGRVSGGWTQKYDARNIGFTEEAGWGYYGSTFVNAALVQSNLKTETYGFDMLLGAYTTYKSLDLFVKGGAMLRMNRTKTARNLTLLYPGNSFTGEKITAETTTTLSPEIKVGGIYNVTERLGISLAYMYVYGWCTHYYETNYETATGINSTVGGSQGPNPMNLLMFGLKYNLA